MTIAPSRGSGALRGRGRRSPGWPEREAAGGAVRAISYALLFGQVLRGCALSIARVQPIRSLMRLNGSRGLATRPERAARVMLPSASRAAGLWLGIGVVMLAVSLVLPFAGIRLGAQASFVPAVLALVGCLDMFSVVLLVREFRDTGEPRSLVLSLAYVFSLVVLGGYAAAFPHVLGSHPPLGRNPSTAPWLWATWHTGFPVLLGVALGPWPRRWTAGVKARRRRRVAWVSVGGCAVTGVAIVAGLVAFDAHLPVLIHGVDTTAMTRVVAPVMLPLVIAGTVLVLAGVRRSAGVERWAALAATAALGDVVLTLLSLFRYSLGWYSGRTLTVVSSAVVLVAFLREFNAVKRRLAQEGERLRDVLACTDELERRQRSLLHHMADGVLMFGADGRVVASNPAAQALVGLTAEQLAEGTRPGPEWRLLAADGTPLLASDLPALRTLRTGNVQREQTIGVEAAPGHVRWLSVNTAIALDSAGVVEHVVASITDVTSRHAGRLLEARQREERQRRVAAVLAGDGLSIVYQPIVDLASGRVVGAEALSRFSGAPPRPPDVWFADADELGLGPDLELTAIRLALRGIEQLPEGAYLSVNLSPSTLVSPEFRSLVDSHCMERVVLELTEHAGIEDYDLLRASLDNLRGRGARLAVDDAGAGFASLRHILNLRPDIIKLDRALVRDVDRDPARRALASSLLTFGRDIDAVIVAEGIETAKELDTLRALDIQYGQGYHLGRPCALPLSPSPIVNSVAAVSH